MIASTSLGNRILCGLVLWLSSAHAAPAPVTLEADCEQTKLRRVHDMETGSNSDQLLERARPAPVSLFAAIPSSPAEYAAVYGDKAGFTPEIASGFAAAQDRLRTLDKKLFSAELAGRNRKAFDKLIARAGGAVILVIGHNIAGRFRFLDGSELPEVDMAAACAGRDAFCVFLTCETDKLQSGSACSAGASCLPTLEHTSRALATSAAQLSAASQISAKSLQDAIRNALRAERRLLQVRPLLRTGVVVGAVDTIYQTADTGFRRP